MLDIKQSISEILKISIRYKQSVTLGGGGGGPHTLETSASGKSVEVDNLY
jgi:hypothetical protein